MGAAGWVSELGLGEDEGEGEDNMGMVMGVIMLNGLDGLGLCDDMHVSDVSDVVAPGLGWSFRKISERMRVVGGRADGRVAI